MALLSQAAERNRKYRGYHVTGKDPHIWLRKNGHIETERMNQKMTERMQKNEAFFALTIFALDGSLEKTTDYGVLDTFWTVDLLHSIFALESKTVTARERF